VTQNHCPIPLTLDAPIEVANHRFPPIPRTETTVHIPLLGGRDDESLLEAAGGAGPGLFSGGRQRRRQSRLAGQTGRGRRRVRQSLAGNFDGQVQEVFSRLGKTLEEAGGALGDMVTMTVFITDARLGDRFTQLRKAIFGDNFPASALITVAGLARPELLVEVQGIAVIG